MRRNRGLLPGILLALVATAWCAGPAVAAPKTDRIVMSNRDRLRVKTDDIGTLDIEWNKVDTLRGPTPPSRSRTSSASTSTAGSRMDRAPGR